MRNWLFSFTLISARPFIRIHFGYAKAFYYEGQSLSDPETYRKIAIEHGLDPEQVLERLNAQETIIDVQNDFNKVRQLDVNSYPSLLLQKDNQIIPIGGGVMTPDKIEARFKIYIKKI